MSSLVGKGEARSEDPSSYWTNGTALSSMSAEALQLQLHKLQTENHNLNLQLVRQPLHLLINVL
jgi:hypothetical protein